MTDTEEPSFEVLARTAEDPPSLEKIIPTALTPYFAQMLDNYKNISEGDLTALLKKRRFTPEPLVDQLRTNFWIEYDRATANRTSMFLAPIYNGYCTLDTLSVIMANPLNVAWIFCKPVTYEMHVDSLLTVGLRRISEILKVPLQNKKTGEFDFKAANLILKATVMLDMRKKGGYVQKNLNLVREHRTIESSHSKESQDLDEKIKRLEAEITKLPSFGDQLPGLPVAQGVTIDLDVEDIAIPQEGIRSDRLKKQHT